MAPGSILSKVLEELSNIAVGDLLKSSSPSIKLLEGNKDDSVLDLAKCIQSWISNPERIEIARKACLQKIQAQYNVHYQVQKIKESLT